MQVLRCNLFIYLFILVELTASRARVGRVVSWVGRVSQSVSSGGAVSMCRYQIFTAGKCIYARFRTVWGSSNAGSAGCRLVRRGVIGNTH